MPFVPVAKLGELPPGKSKEVVVEGEESLDSYIVCNHAGELHALDAICPHRNGPLGAGNFADGRLICPYHGWEFDCVTGEYDRDPTVRIKKYGVRVVGDVVEIELGAEG
ncbi:MAG: Rieske (2Fe-2S) protein [Bryobacter sp.]|nr:Rieske (2Fe-2S) protein [Bryobacter sp.]